MATGRWVVTYFVQAAGAARKQRENFAEDIRNLENNVPKFSSPAARFGLDPMPQMLQCHILVAPCFKNLLRLEAGYPALRCHNLEEEPPSNLKRYRRGWVSSELISETKIIFLLETKGQQPASSFRPTCGQGGRAARGARAAGSKGRRGGAGSATCSCSSWQLADQRRAQLQQRFADLAVHLAQRQLKNLR